jgi:hypothetical protein
MHEGSRQMGNWETAAEPILLPIADLPIADLPIASLVFTHSPAF